MNKKHKNSLILKGVLMNILTTKQEKKPANFEGLRLLRNRIKYDHSSKLRIQKSNFFFTHICKDCKRTAVILRDLSNAFFVFFIIVRYTSQIV